MQKSESIPVELVLLYAVLSFVGRMEDEQYYVNNHGH